MKNKFVFNRLFFIVAMLAAAALSLTAQAGVKFAAFFGDHMVLQRDRHICIWGQGDPGATVEIAIASRQATATVGTNGTWQAYLPATPAGGPYRLIARQNDSTAVIEDVLYGDLWLCSGQSNMQMPVQETLPAERTATNTPHPRLRLCAVGKGWNDTPQTDANIQWQTDNPAAAAKFSAVAYYFASELLQDPALAQVPIGIIDSSVGGTTCEAWIPRPALADRDPASLHDSMFGIKPAMLYNSMIYPLGHSPIKGVIWYQGEGNASYAETYPGLLTTLITEWRRQFDSPDLPFAIVQLPDFISPGGSYTWPWLREAQARVARTVPHTSLVVGIETTDGRDLHPKQKRELGRRAALVLRRDAYHEHLVGSGPVFQSASVSQANLWVTFDTAGSPLASSAPDRDIRGFALAGDDGVYHFAQARIEGDRVCVHSPAVPAPKTVRYAWASVPQSTLGNQAGLPAAPFRTDAFPCDQIEVQPEPISRVVTTPAYEVRVDGQGRVTSLAVHGAQFVSAEPGLAGGTSIPVMFGSKTLADIRPQGPGLLTCTDGQVTFSLQFKPAGMVWTLSNTGTDDLNFNLALAAAVAVTSAGPSSAERVVLTRNQTSLTITGMDSVSPGESGASLHVALKGKTTRELILEIKEK